MKKLISRVKNLFSEMAFFEIKSFYQPRSHPEMYSINLKCVDDPPEIKEVIYFDGINFEESIKNIWMFI